MTIFISKFIQLVDADPSSKSRVRYWKNKCLYCRNKKLGLCKRHKRMSTVQYLLDQQMRKTIISAPKNFFQSL